MKYVNAVNQRYSDVYKKLGKFAFSPYNWELVTWKEAGDDVWGLMKIIVEIPLKIMMSPILLPATVITFTLAALSLLLVAISHPIALLGGKLLDTFPQVSGIDDTKPAYAP